MNFNSLQLITLFSGILLFILGIIFIINPPRKNISNILLGVFLIANAVLLANFFFYITFKLYPIHYQLIHNIGSHSYLLLAPLLYLYIVSLCSRHFQFSAKYLLHILPFIIVVGIDMLINFFKMDLETYLPNPGYFFYSVFKIILYSQIGAYVIASFTELRQYRLQLKEQYSNLIKIDLQWVNLVLYFLILMWSTDVAIFLAGLFHLSGFFVYPYLTYQTISVNLILCICLIYKGMGQTNIAAGKLPVPKYIQNDADISNYQEHKKLLTQIMVKEKPYLLPELSLEELAKKLNITSRLLSQIIHVCFDQNFNNYINQFRVEEAKNLLSEDKKNKKSISEILFDSGFNSKSVSNYSFKKFTGLTPKEFRKKNGENLVLNHVSSR